MSANTDYYWKRIQETEANPVAAYQSKYQDKISQLEANPVTYNSKYQAALDSVLGQIQNRKAFTYDFNADPLYQAYKDQYTKLGKEASMNAVANAAALTGGYGNSYAVTAGAQANQQYLTKLNEMIPELYNLAMNRYKLEGDELNNRYGVLGSAEDRAYGQYRDQVADWKDQLAYLNEAEDRYYGKYRDQVADYNNLLAYLQGAYGTQLAHDEWEAEFALKNRPLGGGGGVVYVGGGNGKNSGSTKVDNTQLKKDLRDNALSDQIKSDLHARSGNENNLKSASDYLNNAVLENRIYQSTAEAVNNGVIPNTPAAQREYIEDLTQLARTVRGWK